MISGLTLLIAGMAGGQVKGEWPMPAHDPMLTARAELPCNMPEAPEEYWSYDLGQEPVGWAMCADVDDDGEDEVLLGASPVICYELDGTEKWTSGAYRVIAVADLDGDGETEIVVNGPRAISGENGQTLWSRTGPGSVTSDRTHVGKLLPGVQGLQIACVSEKEERNQAQVWSFEDGMDEPHLVWEREFNKGPVYAHCTSAVGMLDEQTPAIVVAVHGGLVVLDAKDGKDLARFYWAPKKGEGICRNYGSVHVADLDGDGRAELAIMNDSISVQLGVFSPPPGTTGDQAEPIPSPDVGYGELATYADSPIWWRRYSGFWYPDGEITLHVPRHPIGDVDGDGEAEMIAGEHRTRWEMKIYDALTGEEELVGPNLYPHAAVDLDGDGTREIIASREPGRTPREFTTLVIGQVRNGQWAELGRLASCRMAYDSSPRWEMGASGKNGDQREPVVVGDRELVVTLDRSGDGRADELAYVRVDGNGLSSRSVALANGLDVKVLAASGERLICTTSQATARVMTFDGETVSEWACGKPVIAGACVADIAGDLRNEVILPVAGREVVALSLPTQSGGDTRELWRVDGWGFQAPVAYGPTVMAADIDASGKKEVAMGCPNGAGGVGVKVVDGVGDEWWASGLPGGVDTPAYTTLGKASFGQFDGDGLLDIYVSYRTARTGNDASHSIVLCSCDGMIHWHNDASSELLPLHTLGPTGLPAVASIDGDWWDDILLVALDMCIVLQGRDGTFLPGHEPVIANNIWMQEEKTTQWTAYGTLIPVDLDGDGTLEILSCANWGQWGAWTLDRKLIWTFDPGRDGHSRRHPGIADVDGDGRLEIGAIHNGQVFRCYDAATGEVEWEIEGVTQWVDVATADVDGDGVPEFVTGLAAIKATESGGEVLWEVAVPGGSRSPAIADVDGDGICEIVVGCGDGKVRAYRGKGAGNGIRRF